MNRFSQPVSKAWMLGGSLLATLSWGASPALTAETFYAPHAVHEGTSPANPASPNPFPGAPAAGQIQGVQPARPANQQTIVQPTAFQGNGQAPAASGSVQQQLDEMYRKDGREAPQMNLQKTPLTVPNQAGQSRQPNMQQIQRPGSSVVPPKGRSGILSRINPFKSKSNAATQLPASSAPPPPPPGNQPGYAQQPNFSGQNQTNQFNNRANQTNGQLNQTNGQLNQTNGQNNNQANPPGNPVQQSGNQARQFNNQNQQFNNQNQQFNNQGQQFNNQNQQFNARPEMSIQPGQRSNNSPPIAPPMAPPANNGDELTLPILPGESGFESPVEAPPTDFGPNAPKIQKSEPDLLKDVFSDEPELKRPTKPQLPPAEVLNDEPPLEAPKRNDPAPIAPPQSRQPAASEIDEPLVRQSRFKEDTPLDRLPLPINEAPIDETPSLPPVAEKPVPPVAEKPVPPVAEKPVPPVAEQPVPPVAEQPVPPVAEQPVQAVAAKPSLSEVHDLQLDEKMKIIAERGELRGLKGFCPVGLRDDRDLKNALPEFHSIYKGRTYYFHSADAKTIFDENPRLYAPAASGLDVVLRKSKVLKEGSLDFALWYKERLYLFTSQKTLEQFVATPKEFVAVD